MDKSNLPGWFVLVAVIVLVPAPSLVAAQSIPSDPSPSRPTASVTPRDDHPQVRVVRVPENGFVPDAEMDEAGNLHLAYVAGNDVYYAKSSDHGETFGQPIRVNSEAGFAFGGAFRGPDLAIGKDDTVHVVWYNAGYQQKRPQHEWGVNYSKMAKSGQFEATRNLNQKPSDNFSIAANAKGDVAVVWMAGGIFVNWSQDGGTQFSAPLDLKIDPCECCGSRASFTADGTLNVLFRDKAKNERDTYLAMLTRGAPTIRRVRVSEMDWHIDLCPMTGCFLSSAQHGLIAGWETKGSIYFARLDSQGRNLSGGEMLVSKNGRYPVALVAPDGTALVAWKHGKKLEWQLFDSANKPIAERSTYTAATGDRPAGVVNSRGDFVLFP